jgi:phosphatidylglycerol---prolipoprotein diacylglyceryl transferase
MIDGFPLGPLYIRFYGIILMLGALGGAWLATKEARRRGIDPEIVWDLLVYLIVGGVIGARLWHIFTPPPSSIAQNFTTAYYLSHPLDAIAIWKGGLGIPGALIGGAIAMYFYTRRHKLSFPVWADIAAPSVALGQAIGRWGNFVNQELYGGPTDLPWKLYIDPAHRVQGYENVEYFHPLFAYESILNLANMFFLLWISRRFEDRLKPGDVLLTYLITYPAIRFGLDFLRLDAAELGGVNANQTVVAIVAVAAAVALYMRHRPVGAGAGTVQPARAAAKHAAPRKSSTARKTLAKKSTSRKTPARKSSARKKTS